MSVPRKTIIATAAALALSGSLVVSTAPADAHTYSKEGTVSAKEASKLFKETFKQKCLTRHEARHIVHGSGELWESGSEPGTWGLTFLGTKASRIHSVDVMFDGKCAAGIEAYKR